MIKNKLLAPVMGILAAVATNGLAFVIYALLMTYGKVGDKNTLMAVMVSLCISLVVGGFFSGAKAGSKGLIWGALTGLIYFILMVVMGVMTVPDYTMGTKTLVCAVLVLASGGFGGVIGVNLFRK